MELGARTGGVAVLKSVCIRVHLWLIMFSLTRAGNQAKLKYGTYFFAFANSSGVRGVLTRIGKGEVRRFPTLSAVK